MTKKERESRMLGTASIANSSLGYTVTGIRTEIKSCMHMMEVEPTISYFLLKLLPPHVLQELTLPPEQ